jgi:hypothetical protein
MDEAGTDEISQGPRRDFRLPPGPRRWVTVLGVAGLVAAVTVFAVTRNGDHGGAGGPSVPTPTPAANGGIFILTGPAPTPLSDGTGISTPTVVPVVPGPTAPVPQLSAAPETTLLTCDSVVWGQPAPNWQAGSLRVGTMWLLDGRHLGYARLGRIRQAAGGPAEGSAGGPAGDAPQILEVEMLVHVGAGSAVVMRSAAGSSAYFQFLNSPGSTGDFQGLDGGRGYTFVPCSAPDLRYRGLIALYDVGFSIVPGHTASVEVWTSPSARPVWLTFAAPAGRG